jgi:hypothetical protein
MVKVLKDYFGRVIYSDAYNHRYGPIQDFLIYPQETESYDWVITNAPFRLAEEFVLRSLTLARVGVAILARTVFLESIGRYETIFEHLPPSKFAQFCERVPMLRGRLDRNATTATGYAWFVWEKKRIGDPPRPMWIPPCRRRLERASITIRLDVTPADRTEQLLGEDAPWHRLQASLQSTHGTI